MLVKLIIAFALLSLQQSTNAEYASLVVTINKVESGRGKLIVALFNDEEQFLKSDYINKQLSVTDNGEHVVTFNDLPKGIYAVSVIHDENGNGELDKNLIGIPTEKFGFSNNKMGRFGPPSFEECGIDLNENKEIAIDLKKML
ncbi:MAG: DUF2141 domain-containing protein [Fulvivirga sp.]|uniref:DUF2141 domain-containing protein n=1 Tax=Fulvivirga sp. TaxID=1931237 RepID=UPI0032F05B22